MDEKRQEKFIKKLIPILLSVSPLTTKQITSQVNKIIRLLNWYIEECLKDAKA